MGVPSKPIRQIASTDFKICSNLSNENGDIEDAVQYFTAVHSKIITYY